VILSSFFPYNLLFLYLVAVVMIVLLILVLVRPTEPPVSVSYESLVRSYLIWYLSSPPQYIWQGKFSSILQGRYEHHLQGLLSWKTVCILFTRPQINTHDESHRYSNCLMVLLNQRGYYGTFPVRHMHIESSSCQSLEFPATLSKFGEDDTIPSQISTIKFADAPSEHNVKIQTERVVDLE